MNFVEYSPEKMINEYYEVYIENNIKFLRKHFTDEQISSTLTISLTETNSSFNSYLCKIIDNSNKTITEVKCIKAAYSVLQRILTGTLTKENSLMINLMKVAPNKKIEELNDLVKKQITIPILLQKSPHSSVANKSL